MDTEAQVLAFRAAFNRKRLTGDSKSLYDDLWKCAGWENAMAFGFLGMVNPGSIEKRLQRAIRPPLCGDHGMKRETKRNFPLRLEDL